MIIFIIIIYHLCAGIYNYIPGKSHVSRVYFYVRTVHKEAVRAGTSTVVVTRKLNLNIEKCGCEGVDGPVDQ